MIYRMTQLTNCLQMVTISYTEPWDTSAQISLLVTRQGQTFQYFANSIKGGAGESMTMSYFPP